MKKLSIIVPIYNVEKSLSFCLDSLIQQTISDIEIILIDDGSTDDSKFIAQSYAKKYQKKIVYKRKQNGGLSSARNAGLKIANGKFVGFIDPDDYVDENLFEKMYDQVKNGIKIVECDFIWEFENKKNKMDRSTNYKSLADYLVKGRVEAWNKIYNLKWIKENNLLFLDGILFEDLNFFFKIVSNLTSIGQVKTIHGPLVHYVQHSGTITKTYSKKILQIITSYKDVISYYNKNKMFTVFKSELEYKFCRNILCSFLLKACKIKNYDERKKVLDTFWLELNVIFPNWKHNKYIRRDWNVVNIYLRIMNKYLYKIFYKI